MSTIAVGTIALVVAVAELARLPLLAFVRDWLPGIYLLLGYRLSGFFFVQPMPRAEQWLAAVDRRLFDATQLTSFVPQAPRLLLECLELAYLFCYPLVPAGYAVLYFTGLHAETDRFWTMVLLAELACYGMLPWIQTRPPRVLEPTSPIESRNLLFRGLNLGVLQRGSIQVNTVPSGHAAGAFATALAVAGHRPLAGMILGFIAFGIVVGSVIGRYHYAVDGIAGVLVALAAWGLISWFWV